MNEKTIATIGLKSNYTDLQAVLHDASRWLEVAAAQGADLAVLPETINLLHSSSGPPEALALEDWQAETALLREAAIKHQVSLALPLLVRDGGTLANRFYLLGRDGSELGYYQKRVPAVGERLAGIQPAYTSPICWEGILVGGGICIDTYFPHEVFDPQLEAGADLILIPSMTPAGTFLDTNALACGVPFVLAYSPWSRILDRDGKELAAGGYRSESLRAGFGLPVQMATINFNAVTLFADFNQDKIPAILRHYGNKVRIRFDQSSCVFFLESRSHDLSIHEIMRQFDLVSRRDYFAKLNPGDVG